MFIYVENRLIFVFFQDFFDLMNRKVNEQFLICLYGAVVHCRVRLSHSSLMEKDDPDAE